MSDENDHKYGVTFDVDVHEDGITNAEVEERGCAASDALLMVAVMGDASSPEYQIWPYGFRPGLPDDEMTHDEIFRICTTMICKLAESDQLSDPKKSICTAIRGSFEFGVATMGGVEVDAEGDDDA